MSKPWRGDWGPEAIPHGTIGGFTNWDCHCKACRAAWAAYIRARRQRIARERAARGEHPVQPTYRNGVVT